MSGPISPIESNGLELALKSFETADNKTIRIALEAIQNSLTPSFLAPISTSEEVESNPLILRLFEAIQGSSLTWVQVQGYESGLDLAKKRLEHYLWNHIEAPTSLDSTYDGLSDLVLARSIPGKIPEINIPSDETVDRLTKSLLQESLIGEEGEISLEEEFRYFSERVEKRFEYLIKSELGNKEELQKMQGEFQKLKTRIETYPKAQLFSEDDQERKEQYYKFGVRLGVAFAWLLMEKNEDLLFQRIPEFLDTCFKGWDEHILQLMAMGSNESIYLSPQLEAWKFACLMRRSIVEKALAQAFPGFENDVHYQNAARLAMNQPFHLGFSEEEMGKMEPVIIALVTPAVKQKTGEMLASQGKDELIDLLISKYKTITSEEEKKGIFAEVLTQYEEKVKQDPSFLIDLLEEVESAFQQFQTSGTLNDLKELRDVLQETGITSFSTKLSYERNMEEMQKKDPRFFAKFRKYVSIKEEKEKRDYFTSLLPKEQKTLQEWVASDEGLRRDDQIAKELQEIQKAANFLSVRALYNRDLLETKFNEEERFGASAWAIGAKVLHLGEAQMEDLNTRILQWIQELPFSPNQRDQILGGLSLSIEQLKAGEMKTALQSCLANKDLDALLSLRSRTKTFSSLEEVLCFGSVDDLRRWKAHSPIDNEDFGEAVNIVSARGDLLLLQEILSDQPLSEDDRNKAVINAAKGDHLEVVSELLKSGEISIDARGIAVKFAASFGRLDIILKLLENGATILGKDRAYAIAEAELRGYVDVVQKLKENVTISELDGGGAAEQAASLGRLDIIRKLLEDGAVISQENRETAVKYAAAGGHLEVVSELLRGGEISESARGMAVLCAARLGYLGIVSELLKSGKISKYVRGPAVLSALQEGHLDVALELLMDSTAILEEDRSMAVLCAAELGYLDIVRKLLEDGAVISQENRETAVKYAAAGGHLEVVSELLRGGEIPESSREAARQSAAGPNREKIIALLNQLPS